MKKNFNWFGYALTYVFSVFLMGFINLAFANFDFSVVGTAQYWFNTTSSSAIMFLLFHNSTRLNLDLKIETDEVYNRNEDDIQKNLNLFLTEQFDEFIIDYNYKNKKKAWLEHWRSKKGKLLDKQPYSVSYKRNTLKEEEWKWYWFKVKRYARKQRKIDKFLSDEWIGTYLQYKKFKYPKITRQEVISGFDKPHRQKSLLDKGYLMRSIAKKSWMIILFTGITAIVQILQFDGNPINTNAIMQAAFQLLMGTINVITGLSDGKRIFKSSVVTNQNIRLTIIDTYLRTISQK